MNRTTSVQTTINPAILVGVFGVLTLIGQQVGFAGNFMWWVTAVTAVALIIFMVIAMAAMARLTKELRTGKRRVESPTHNLRPFTKQAVINTMFIIVLLFLLDMHAIWIAFFLTWLINQIVLGGLANTLTQTMVRT